MNEWNHSNAHLRTRIGRTEKLPPWDRSEHMLKRLPPRPPGSLARPLPRGRPASQAKPRARPRATRLPRTRLAEVRVLLPQVFRGLLP